MTDLFAIQETSLAVLRGDRAVCLLVQRKEARGGGTDFITRIPWYYAVSQIRGAASRIKICP